MTTFSRLVKKGNRFCRLIANYKIATIFKSKIEENEIPTYLERAYLKGHSDALNTMFELSEEYRNKYKSSILIRNDNDLKLANDLLDLAAKYNHPKALSMHAIFLSQLKLKAQLQTQEQIAKENAVAPKVQGIKPKDNPIHEEL